MKHNFRNFKLIISLSLGENDKQAIIREDHLHITKPGELHAGVPYGARPTRPRSYLDFENRRPRRQRRRAAVIEVLPDVEARPAPVVPLT